MRPLEDRHARHAGGAKQSEDCGGEVMATDIEDAGRPWQSCRDAAHQHNRLAQARSPPPRSGAIFCTSLHNSGVATRQVVTSL